jgi:hypothetical protein
MLLAVAVAASLAQAAGAQDGQRRWIALGSPERSALVYGTPDSDDLVIGFACLHATRQIAVAFTHEPLGAKDGMRVGIELSSESTHIALDATGQRLALDDIFLLEAKTTLSPALRRILTKGRTLTVMVQDGVEEIPLQGAAKAAADLIEACG